MAGNTYSAVQAVHAKTTNGTDADQVTLTGDWNDVEVVIHGTPASPVYVRFDGATAVVGADQNFVLPPGAPSVRVRGVPAFGSTVISIIAASAVTYSVTGLD